MSVSPGTASLSKKSFLMNHKPSAERLLGKERKKTFDPSRYVSNLQYKVKEAEKKIRRQNMPPKPVELRSTSHLSSP